MPVEQVGSTQQPTGPQNWFTRGAGTVGDYTKTVVDPAGVLFPQSQTNVSAYTPDSNQYFAGGSPDLGMHKTGEQGQYAMFDAMRVNQAQNRGGPNVELANQARALQLASGRNIGRSAYGLEGQADRLNAYADQGPGPSAAQAQLRMAQDDNMRSALALAGSGRGMGGNAALRNASNQRAAIAGQTAGQAGLLRATEEDAWRGRQLQAMQGAGQLQGAAGNLYTAQTGALGGVRGQDLGQQQSELDYRRANDAAALGWEQASQGREGQAFQWAAMDQQGRMQAEQDRNAALQHASDVNAGYGNQAQAQQQGIGAGILGAVASIFSDVRAKDRIQPSQGKATEAIRSAPAYSYEYKPGMGPPGPQVGPMAQDLERTPEGRQSVVNTPDGKAIDAGRLTLTNTAALSEQQQEIDRLKRDAEALKRSGNWDQWYGNSPSDGSDQLAALEQQAAALRSSGNWQQFYGGGG